MALSLTLKSTKLSTYTVLAVLFELFKPRDVLSPTPTCSILKTRLPPDVCEPLLYIILPCVKVYVPPAGTTKEPKSGAPIVAIDGSLIRKPIENDIFLLST